jgi:amphiphysin
MQDKLQSYADGKYDLTRQDFENIYFDQRGDAAEQMDQLTITKRMVSTGQFCSERDRFSLRWLTVLS